MQTHVDDVGVTGTAGDDLADELIAVGRTGVDRDEFDRVTEFLASDDRAPAAFARWGLDAVDNRNLLEAVCVANSFGASTLVALADGTHAPIADVQVGDEVLAYDFDIDSTVGREVTATLPHTDWLLEAHFSDGTTMNVTEDHRFWSVTDDDWVELQDLDTSDVLLSPDGATVTVDWLDWDAGVTTDAYDLTVDQEHNFFVTADTTGEPVLVHNQTQGLFCGLPVSARHVSLSGADDILSDESRDILRSGLALLRDESPARLSAALDALAAGGDQAAARVFVERAGQFPEQFLDVASRGWVEDYVNRDFLWAPEALNFSGEVPRTVRFREPGPPTEQASDIWGVTSDHLRRHLTGNGEPSLATFRSNGELNDWLDATEELLSRAPRDGFPRPRSGENFSDGVERSFVQIRGDFSTAAGDSFRLEVVLHVRDDGTFDFVTWLTNFERQNFR